MEARRGAGALDAQALGSQVEARRGAAHDHYTAVRPATRPAKGLRYGAGPAIIQPRARGLKATCARKLSRGCAHGALGQFLTQVHESLFGHCS